MPPLKAFFIATEAIIRRCRRQADSFIFDSFHGLRRRASHTGRQLKILRIRRRFIFAFFARWRQRRFSRCHIFRRRWLIRHYADDSPSCLAFAIFHEPEGDCFSEHCCHFRCWLPPPVSRAAMIFHFARIVFDAAIESPIIFFFSDFSCLPGFHAAFFFTFHADVFRQFHSQRHCFRRCRR